MKVGHGILIVLILSGLVPTRLVAAQDLTPGETYVCNGERMFIENCNIRDLSDTSTCMVGHPDHIQANGLMQYTTMTRAALKKLFPTCTQPSAKQIAAAHAFQEKQQNLYDANAQKANQRMQQTQAQPTLPAQLQQPKDPEARAMNRCITSGRLPASCTGNSLLGAFTQMVGQVLPSLAKTPPAGPEMRGAYAGAGNWRLDFSTDGGVLVNCSFLSPNQETYSLDFKENHAIIVINTTPKPLVLTLRSDGTIVGPGPVTINGVVASGYTEGHSTPGHTETQEVTTHEQLNQADAQLHAGDPNLSHTEGGYDLATTTTQSNYVPGTSTPGYSTFSPRRATCPALDLSTKGAGVGIQTMQTDLLKTAFGGEKGPPTPPGVRMHGIFAASTGFSVQFFPESVILGCGPDAARAYPYAVVAEGSKAVIKVDAPDHPLSLTYSSDGSLDPGDSSPYQVHGRVITGQDDNDDFSFAPMERTCKLAVLTRSTTIPTSGGSTGTMAANPEGSAGGSAGVAKSGLLLSTPNAPTGNAILSIVSGFPSQPGAPNPLAGRPYVLLRDSYANSLANGDVSVPTGMSPYKYVGSVCTGRTPDCEKVMNAIKSEAASAVRADANGAATFPGVPPGTYYLMIATRYNNQPLTWAQPIQLQAGPNSITLDERNASPVQ